LKDKIVLNKAKELRLKLDLHFCWKIKDDE
jgi:hypothetical protein